MRVLQLIDSLEVGGAERVAVNIANSLASRIEESYLCATRKEGVLKESLNSKVAYLFLNKTKIFHFKSIKKLSNFIRDNKITIIHAHSSSFFLAFLVKLINPKLKIIWQDHYGNSEYLSKRKFRVLRFCSNYFAGILSVNSVLEIWAKKNLKTKSVYYFPNFAVQDGQESVTQLNGLEGQRILHLANLRQQKDHESLIRAFMMVLEEEPKWTLHCVGKDFKDEYSESIFNLVNKGNLKNKVFFYGIRLDVKAIIEQCDIGVLSSKSEGLPLSLLEYGLSGLPSVVTNVGDCNLMISSEHKEALVEKENIEGLKNALLAYIQNIELRKKAGKNIKSMARVFFSEKAIINNLLIIYSKI